MGTFASSAFGPPLPPTSQSMPAITASERPSNFTVTTISQETSGN